MTENESNVCFRSHSYYKLIPELVSAGFRVIVLDFIGFGRSDKLTDWRTYSLELHKSTVEQLLRHLQLLPSQNNPYEGHYYHKKLTLVKRERNNRASLLSFQLYLINVSKLRVSSLKHIVFYFQSKRGLKICFATISVIILSWNCLVWNTKQLALGNLYLSARISLVLIAFGNDYSKS